MYMVKVHQGKKQIVVICDQKVYGWHPVFLINVADLMNVPLVRLFQKALIDGVVPPQWLVASVTAIHKKGQNISQKTTDQ